MASIDDSRNGMRNQGGIADLIVKGAIALVTVAFFIGAYLQFQVTFWLALIAAFEGREVPAARFESVCYGMLARGMALSIHGRFRTAGGAILEAPGPKDTDAVGPEQEAQNADDWYRNIVAGAFGA